MYFTIAGGRCQRDGVYIIQRYPLPAMLQQLPAGTIKSGEPVFQVLFLYQKMKDLAQDYFAASLHKWLCCPIGLGVLKIKLTHIEKIFPLMADSDWPINNIRKFEHQGTRPINSLQTIPVAIQFHQAIGDVNKEQRLKSLKGQDTNPQT